MKVRELRSEAEIEEAYPIMRELHDALAEMIPAGYRLFALREDDGIVALAGAQVLTNRYYGRHFHDLVVTKEARANGYGQKLLSHVEQSSRREGGGYVAPACGRERTSALRFYERPGYSMRKSLRTDVSMLAPECPISASKPLPGVRQSVL